MERKDIFEIVQLNVATVLHQEVEDITEETNLEEMNMDSLDAVEILIKAENDFGIKIPDEEMEKAVTVGDIVDFVEKRLE